MKIVFSTDQVYLHGGIEKTMATKANYFANLAHVEVFIVTTEQRGMPPCYELDARIHLIDLDINYDRNKSYFSKENLIKVIQHLRRQNSLFRTLKPDVVISPNFNYDHYWLPFLLAKTKVIKERHGSRFFENNIRKKSSFINRLKFAFNDWLDAQYDHIIVLNRDEKEYIKSGNAVVIPNSVPIPDYKAELTQKAVIAAGRISPVKAFDQLIEAWKIVNRRFPDWELHIFGEDYLDSKNKLTKLINSLGLQNVVIFKHSVDDLQGTMKNYSIYAMSSLTECFPMVLLEALSVGVPIISYDSPNGPKNIITDQVDGLLAKYRDPQDLAKKLIVLMDDEIKRREMGTFAKKNVERFSNEKVMQLWCNLLNLQNV